MMNLNSILLANALSLLEDVIDIDITTNSSSATYVVKCSNKKRFKVKNRIMQLLYTYGKSPNFEHDSKSKFGYVTYENIKIYIKPAEKNDYVSNEIRLVDMWNEYMPTTIVFHSNDNSHIISDINNVVINNSKATRDCNGLVNKEDVAIFSNKARHSISIKMCGGATWWESADSLYGDYAEECMSELINRFNITDFDYKKLKKDILLDTHHDNLLGNVYGNDILPHGCVVATNFNKYRFSGSVLSIECDNVFTGVDVLHDIDYKPVLLLTKSKGRNKKRTFIKNICPKVATQKRAKTAIKYTDITKVEDIYDY